MGGNNGAEGQRHRQRLLRGAVMVAILLSPAGSAPADAGPAATAQAHVASTSFVADQATVLVFLEEADIVGNDSIGVGITGSRRLTLERDGIRLRAAFRHVDEIHERHRMPDGRFYQRLRDYSGYEVAAYRLSRLLGMDNVPPTVHRRVSGRYGTVQLWIENAMMESDRITQKLHAPHVMDWVRQTQEMLAFDELIGNIDRTSQNFVIDPDWKLWLIDHSRAFQQGDELRDPGRIRLVRREFLTALCALRRQDVESAIGHDVDRRRINELMARRDLLLAHFRRLIEERGEGAIVWQPMDAGVSAAVAGLVCNR